MSGVVIGCAMLARSKIKAGKRTTKSRGAVCWKVSLVRRSMHHKESCSGRGMLQVKGVTGSAIADNSDGVHWGCLIIKESITFPTGFNSTQTQTSSSPAYFELKQDLKGGRYVWRRNDRART